MDNNLPPHSKARERHLESVMNGIEHLCGYLDTIQGIRGSIEWLCDLKEKFKEYESKGWPDLKGNPKYPANDDYPIV